MSEHAASFDLRSIDEVTSLQLYAETDPRSPYRAVLATPALRATVMISISRTDFAGYFSDLAVQWRGWTGVKEYLAHAPDVDYGPPALQIGATADGLGHTALTVNVGVPSCLPTPADWREVRARRRGQWTAAAVILIEAGQLDEIAAYAHQLPYDSGGLW